MSWEDKNKCNNILAVEAKLISNEGNAGDVTFLVSNRRNISRNRSPLVCITNEEGSEDMDQYLLSADSITEYGNGKGLDTCSMSTPQPSPLPNCCTRNVAPGLRYRNLGKSGLRVSSLGLATWMLSNEPPETLENIVTLAYESGINLFDLSDAYSGPSAEIELGKVLKKKNWKRSSYIIIVKIYWTTKIEERGLSRKYILDCVKNSLERLQLEFIDVLLIHRVDPHCPVEEVVRSMNHVINMGQVLYWGTSKWPPIDIMEAYSNCRQFNCITPIVEQAEYHFFCRDKPELYMSELYNKIGMGLMTYSPITMSFYKAFGKNSEESMALAFKSSMKQQKKITAFNFPVEIIDDTTLPTTTVPSTLPTNVPAILIVGKENVGKEKSGSIHSGSIAGSQTSKTVATVPEETPAQKMANQQRITREIINLAEKYGCNLSQLIIAWCLKNESVNSMLIGPTSTHDLLSYVQALQLIPKLTTAVMTELEKILENRPQRPPMISSLAASQAYNYAQDAKEQALLAAQRAAQAAAEAAAEAKGSQTGSR